MMTRLISLQVRLCLDKQDFIRAQILSRKISPRAFVEKKGEAKGVSGSIDQYKTVLG